MVKLEGQECLTWSDPNINNFVINFVKKLFPGVCFVFMYFYVYVIAICFVLEDGYDDG